jgi:hypothetical protein
MAIVNKWEATRGPGAVRLAIALVVGLSCGGLLVGAAGAPLVGAVMFLVGWVGTGAFISWANVLSWRISHRPVSCPICGDALNKSRPDGSEDLDLHCGCGFAHRIKGFYATAEGLD